MNSWHMHAIQQCLSIKEQYVKDSLFALVIFFPIIQRKKSLPNTFIFSDYSDHPKNKAIWPLPRSSIMIINRVFIKYLHLKISEPLCQIIREWIIYQIVVLLKQKSWSSLYLKGHFAQLTAKKHIRSGQNFVSWNQ